VKKSSKRRSRNGGRPEESLRVGEEPSESYRRNRETPNAQRPTFNAQWQKQRQFDLEERLPEFSARIIEIVDARPNTRATNHISGQLLRCGASPYGNHGEVQAAESRRDCVHKLRVLRETEELIKIFFTSIRTADRNGA